MDYLKQHEHSKWLGQLELLGSAVSLRKLEMLSFHDHQVPNFQFFDLEQLKVPELVAEKPVDYGTGVGGDGVAGAGAIGQSSCDETGGESPGGGEGGEESLTSDQKKAKTDDGTKKQSLHLLKDILTRCSRAAVLGSAGNAPFLLQACASLALNALLAVTPSPQECIRSGVKSNVEDLDPDAFVGLLTAAPGLKTKLEKNAAASAGEGEGLSEEASQALEQAKVDLEKQVLQLPETKAERYSEMVSASCAEYFKALADAEGKGEAKLEVNLLWLHLGVLSRSLVATLLEMKSQHSGAVVASSAAAAKKKEGKIVS